jgi:predicted nucleic acid-binding protein
MIIVLDASAAIEIVLEKESADHFRESLKKSDLVLAPDTFPSEITNVFWKYASFSNMSKEACDKGIDYCLDLIDDYIETKELCREVFSESINEDHPVYDLFYLILARRYNATLVSKDKKMKKIAKKMKINIIE